jgi:ribosomal protein S1
MEVTGKVKRVSEYGAFVDIGVGRDGLLHISELSTSRIRKVDDLVKEGDEINVWIKELDRDKNRISLTMIPPGTKTIRDLAVGELVSGTVQRLTNYGAFVDIGLERDAMLHVKEMADGYVAKPEDVVKVGDEIEARISGVDARRGRVDLSLKGLRPALASDSSAQDIELQPMGEVAEDEELPTLMEMAFRQALDGDEDFPAPTRSRKPKRRKGRDRYEQDDIISRTLRYRG